MEITSKSYLSLSLILQTMQQLIAVYGNDTDKILKGNTNNIIYLKSNDIAMLDELVSMGGKTHNERNNSIAVTKNEGARIKKTENRVTITKTVVEEDVLSRNDFLHIKPRESIVLRASNDPIYNYGMCSLPPAYLLHKNQISIPGQKFTLQTVPTMSSALEFDPRENQPNFYAMVEKRVAQARLVEGIEANYKEVYGYNQIAIDRMDPEVYAREIMDAVNDMLHYQNYELQSLEDVEDDVQAPPMSYDIGDPEDVYARKALQREKSLRTNDDYYREDNRIKAMELKDYDKKMYAGERVSRQMLVDRLGKSAIADGSFRTLVLKSVLASKGQFLNDSDYRWDDKENILRDDLGQVLISYENEAVETFNEQSEDEHSRIYTDSQDDADTYFIGYVVHDVFILKLAKLNTWRNIARGSFEKHFIKFWDEDNGEEEDESIIARNMDHY